MHRREIVTVCTQSVALRDGDRESLMGVRKVGLFLAILHYNFNLTVMD
jgi:hypothetical protein